MNSPANAAQPSGANAPLGQNGCTYPTDVPTLFNQLNAARKTWKGYAFTYTGNSFNNANAYPPDLGGPAELHQLDHVRHRG